MFLRYKCIFLMADEQNNSSLELFFSRSGMYGRSGVVWAAVSGAGVELFDKLLCVRRRCLFHTIDICIDRETLHVRYIYMYMYICIYVRAYMHRYRYMHVCDIRTMRAMSCRTFRR